MSRVGGQGQVCIEIMESCTIVYRFKDCLFFKVCEVVCVIKQNCLERALTNCLLKLALGKKLRGY